MTKGVNNVRKRKDQGAAFITALIVVVVLTMVVASFGARLKTHLRTERIRIEQRRARDMANAALARALVSIQIAEEDYTTSLDEWPTLGQNGAEEFTVGNGSFRIEIIDAGSRLNINTINRETLERLNFTDEQIDSLLDWREENFQPRAQGAKDQYYNQLPEPYNAKLRPFDTVDELLLVKGFTPQDIFEPKENVSGQLLIQGNAEDQPSLFEIATVDSLSQNVRSDGEARVNVNTADDDDLEDAGLDENTAEAIVQYRNSQGTFETLGEVFQVPNISNDQAEDILNNLTVTGDTFVRGKINMNTASEAVLNAIPNISQDLVQDILSRQGTIEELGELATMPGVDNQQLQDVADYFTVNSQAYIVRIEGRYGPARYALQAVIVLDEGVPKIQKVQQPLFPDYALRWNWPDEPEFETTLVSPL